MINYDKFEKSLKQLQIQFNNYKKKDTKKYLDELDKEAIDESVIQRFEVCYDCLWKILKRYLVEELGIVDLPNSPKPIFRIAFENKLLINIEQWIRYVNARINTSHDYSEDKAYAVLEIMNDFILDAINLYMTMTGKTWE